MTAQTVFYDCERAIARIVLARPEHSNAFDVPMARAFDAAVQEASDDAVRAVIVASDGQRFCAGGDVGSMVAAENRAAYLTELAGTLDAALLRLAALDKPVVAAVQGAAAGAGLALVLSCDLVIAARSAKFLMAYSGVGLTPDCGVTYLLPRAVGQQRSLELALTGRVLSASDAQDWGIVTEVVDDSTARDRALEVAEQLAAGPVHALGQTKHLLRSSWERTREAAGQRETATIAEAVTRRESASLIESFGRRSKS